MESVAVNSQNEVQSVVTASETSHQLAEKSKQIHQRKIAKALSVVKETIWYMLKKAVVSSGIQKILVRLKNRKTTLEFASNM